MKKINYLTTAFFLLLFTPFFSRAQDYCTAAGLDGTTSDFITRVRLYDINHGSEQSLYSDFTAISTDLVQGADYTVFVHIGFAFDLDSAYVWIDFNQNFTFEESEQISMSAYVDNISTGTVSVPGDATLGPTRMRVRSIYTSGGGDDPCNDYFGEVEDYSVNIIPATCATVGQPCDDGQECTMNDTLDANCNCVGEMMDDDFDGVCNEDDQCPGLDDSIDEDNNGFPDLCENYCAAAGSNGTGADYISRVRLYTLNNPSIQTDYSDFTAISTTLVQGAEYTLTVHLNAVFAEDLAHAWIDYNQDALFQEEEAVDMSLFSLTDNTSTGTVLVPADAPLGSIRMRVRNIWSPDLIDFPQCGSYFGEVEDYTINIVEATCTTVGDACDDGQDCTTNDTIDANCNCVGEMMDDDFDGVCNEEDECPGMDDIWDLDENGVPDCQEFCAAAGLEGTGNDYITSVFLEDVEHSSEQSLYSDFTNISILLERGLTYALAVQLNEVFDEDQAYAWIDYNQNMRFESEEGIEMLPFSGDILSSGEFTVPETALQGETRMRVRNIWSTEQVADPCGEYFGEVEDYTIIIDMSNSTSSLSQQSLSLFPNPAKNIVNVDLGPNANGFVKIHSTTGSLITQFVVQQQQFQISTNDWAPGIYFLQYMSKSGDGPIVRKLVIE